MRNTVISPKDRDDVRQTSIETWGAIQASGLVSKTRLRVYNFLYSEGPHTQNEINASLRSGEVNPSYHKRLSELERMGLVQSVRERECKITDRVCMEWATTDRSVPIPLVKPPTKSEIIVGLDLILSDLANWLERSTNGISPANTRAASVKLRERVTKVKVP